MLMPCCVAFAPEVYAVLPDDDLEGCKGIEDHPGWEAQGRPAGRQGAGASRGAGNNWPPLMAVAIQNYIAHSLISITVATKDSEASLEKGKKEKETLGWGVVLVGE